MDVLLAIPYLLLAIGPRRACTLGGTGCLGGLIKPGLGVVIFVIAFTSWTYMTRIIRGQVLSLREKEFIESARSVGASHPRIIFKEVLPNLVAPIIVYASILIPQVILYEAALSFLGVGVQPPTASWGQMISDATPTFSDAWWYMLFPGLALLFTVLAFNLIGRRDAGRAQPPREQDLTEDLTCNERSTPTKQKGHRDAIDSCVRMIACLACSPCSGSRSLPAEAAATRAPADRGAASSRRRPRHPTTPRRAAR